MTLPELLETIDDAKLDAIMTDTSPAKVAAVCNKQSLDFADFLALLSQEAGRQLPLLAAKARELTIRRFGKVIQFYAPVYLSNFCENHCLYCGFNKANNTPRMVLPPAAQVLEYRELKKRGMDNVLLLTGEAPARAGIDYMAAAVEQAAQFFTFVGLEIYPLPVEGYRRLVQAGADGLTIYQETYDPAVYRQMHLVGRKQDYPWRLATPERALQAGIRKVGLGVLLGLADWRREAARLALHVRYLQKHYWQGEISISFPRIQPFSSSFAVPAPVCDREFIQLMCALRLLFPDVGFALSTRESPGLRDKLMELCITQMSAGSRTNPGGYTDAATEEQFAVADHRELPEMMAAVSARGYDPVIKDWDKIF